MDKEADYTSSTEQTTTSATKQKKSFRTLKFIWRHKLNFLLLLALLTVAAWGLLNIHSLKNELAQRDILHAAKIDSLQNERYMQLSRVFSWAIRSDMMRNNLDQTNQYLIKIIEETNITKAYIINSENNEILLSSKSEDIGSLITDATLLNIPTSQHVKIGDKLKRFASPITGFNEQIGTIVFEVAAE